MMASPFSTAAQYGQVETVELLHALGQYRDFGQDGETPFAAAVHEYQEEMLSVLTRFIAKRRSPWRRAWLRGFVGRYGDGGAVIDTKAVFAAAREAMKRSKRGELGPISMLRTQGRTPMCVAARAGQVEVIRTLRKLGASLNTGCVPDTRIWTALGASMRANSRRPKPLSFLAPKPTKTRLRSGRRV